MTRGIILDASGGSIASPRGLMNPSSAYWTASISVPITDGSIQVQRNLISEKSISNAGEPVIYGGNFGCSGSFAGVYRPVLFATCMTDLLYDTPGTCTIHASDEFGNAYKFGSCSLQSGEITIKSGDFAKCSFNWVGQYATSTGECAVSETGGDTTTPIFYNIELDAGGTIGKIKCTEFTLRINRPLDASDFVIGSEYTQSIVQSDNRTIEGSLTLTAREHALFIAGLCADPITSNTDSNLGPTNTHSNPVRISSSLTITLRSPDGTSTLTYGTLTLSNVSLSDASLTMSGRQKIQKQMNFRCTGLTIS